MDAWFMISAVAVFDVVIGKLLYELDPSLCQNAAASGERDSPPDGAIDNHPNGWKSRQPGPGH
jgi:hypothetical protein